MPARSERRPGLLAWFLTLGTVWLAAGCGELEANYDNDQLRIVSLAPAITQVLLELGLADAIVAVGDEDHIAPAGTPSLGRFNDLDLERLTTLAPTHVLAMTLSAGLPPRVTEWAQRGRFELADLAYPSRAADAAALIESVGEALGREAETAALAAEVQRQLDGIATLMAGRETPRALLVFGASPVMACGPGTVHDDLLQIAGGQNAAADSNVTAPVYGREAMRALAPEVIFLMRPGDAPLAGANDSRLDAFRGLDLPAMRDERVILLNDPAVLLPGPSMATTAVSMGVALHPELAEEIAEVFRGTP